MSEYSKEDKRMIAGIINDIVLVYSFLLLLPMAVSFFYKEENTLNAFLPMFIILVISCPILKFSIFRRYIKGSFTLKNGIISLFLAWIIISILSSIPFVYHHTSIIDSLFESFSGWTGTGFSMFADPSILPASLLFWRALIQWAGGLGVAVLAIFIINRTTTFNLFRAEGRQEDFYLNLKKIGKFIIVIYLTYTIILILLMRLFGVPLFDSSVNIMSAIATGGFSNVKEGIDSFGIAPTILIIVAMIIGAISFEVHYLIRKGQFKKILESSSLKAMFILIIIASVIIFIQTPTKHPIKGDFFYVVSALTGTGHQTNIPITSLGGVSFIVIILLMLCGGMYGSTSGAIKIWRIVILYKALKRQIVKVFLPSKAIVPITVEKRSVDDETSLDALSYIALYILLIFAGTIIFIYHGYTSEQSLFTIVSAQGNVGLNVLGDGLITLPASLKILLIVQMLLGRIEILPLFVFIRGFMNVRGA